MGSCRSLTLEAVAMPESFVFGHTSFDKDNKPYFLVQCDGEIMYVDLLGKRFSLEFDLSKKYCTGWFDFENRISQPCPENLEVDDKYDACVACQKRTGFNPAFYHATSVSPQQEKINQQPHYVYLAYFGPKAIKVGISQKDRGLRRLLEQGARLVMVLETFSSAVIARSYEERISRQCKVREQIGRKQKLSLLRLEFNHKQGLSELHSTLERIEKSLDMKFENVKLIETQDFYTHNDANLSSAITPLESDKLAGTVVAMVGSFCITSHQGQNWIYDLKSFTGYRATQLHEPILLEQPVEQMSFF